MLNPGLQCLAWLPKPLAYIPCLVAPPVHQTHNAMALVATHLLGHLVLVVAQFLLQLLDQLDILLLRGLLGLGGGDGVVVAVELLKLLLPGLLLVLSLSFRKSAMSVYCLCTRHDITAEEDGEGSAAGAYLEVEGAGRGGLGEVLAIGDLVET